MLVPSGAVPVHTGSVPMAGSAGSGSQPGRFPVPGSIPKLHEKSKVLEKMEIHQKTSRKKLSRKPETALQKF